MGLPILGVLNGKEENVEEEDREQEATDAKEPTLENYKSCMRKFIRYYFVNPQYAARTQKHYLQNYLQKPKDLGIRHVVARL
eukprot:3744970-Ditylum_brightwellii.AAC.1